MKEYMEVKNRIEVRHYLSHPEEEDVVMIMDSNKGKTIVLNGDDAKDLLSVLAIYSK